MERSKLFASPRTNQSIPRMRAVAIKSLAMRAKLIAPDDHARLGTSGAD